MIKTFRELGRSRNCLVTVAIGDTYLQQWQQHALKSWMAYAEKYDLGIFALTESLYPEQNPKWKKPNWQKLLIGRELLKQELDVNFACFLDTDILISPLSPNIFDLYDGTSYGLVSQIKNMPMPLELVLRQFVFLRHKFYSPEYPLDSGALMTPEQQYEFSGLSPFDDLACTGLFLFNPTKSSTDMENWYFKYTRNYRSVTGGEQVHLNWEMLNTGEVQWLPYEFQAIWVYEMAWKYPFLYANDSDKSLIRECIEASLFSNHFLHFAGSWHESDMWLDDKILHSKEKFALYSSFNEYLHTPVTGSSKGMIKP